MISDIRAPHFDRHVRFARGHHLDCRTLTGKHASQALFPRYNCRVYGPDGRRAAAPRIAVPYRRCGALPVPYRTVRFL